MSIATRKPVRIAPEQIAQIAAEGVVRALASRQAALAELSAEEVEQVSGGGLVPVQLLPPIIAGGLVPLEGFKEVLQTMPVQTV